MTGPEGPSTVTSHARAAEQAIHQLCRATVTRPTMTVAEVSDVFADLATAIAALPQAAGQLGDILERAEHDRRLVMDPSVETDDPGDAIDTARLQLDALRGPADEVQRLLDAAHNHTAHITTAGPRTRRAGLNPHQLPEDRRPNEPPPGTGVVERGPAPPR